MNKCRRVRAFAAGIVCASALISKSNLVAQQYSQAELGAGVESHTFTGIDGSRSLNTGPLAQLTYNLSSFLAVEGSAAYFPEYTRSPTQQNGQEFSALGGIKAGVRKKHFGIFGKIEPGLASFSCGLGYLGSSGELINCQRRTSFAFQYGGVAEYYLSPRWALRGDVAQSLVTEFDQTLARYTNGFPAEIVIGHEETHLDTRLSIVRRFGELSEDASPSESKAPLDIGVLYGMQARVHHELSAIGPDNGAGLWVSWNAWRFCALDATAFYLPTNDGFIGLNDGGPALESFVGPKIGFRNDKIGVFAKIRPGTIVFSRVIDSQVPPIASETTYSKSPNFALDTGGVVEVYPARHVVLRIDAGNETIFYHSRTFRVNGQPSHIDGTSDSSFLFLTGVGIRF